MATACVVVPRELIQDVIVIVKGILLDDVRERRQLYQRLGLPPDASVDVEAMESFYADV